MQFALPLALAGLAAAQSATTVSLFIPDADSQPLVASVVAASAGLTTYQVACSPGVDADDCGFPVPFTLVSGPSTIIYDIAGPGDGFALTGHCDVTASTTATCTETSVAGRSGSSGQAVQTTETTPDYLAVVVTAGQALLGGSGSSAASASLNAGTAVSATTTTGASTAAASATTGTKSAAAPPLAGVEGHVGWSGAAAAAAALAAAVL